MEKKHYKVSLSFLSHLIWSNQGLQELYAKHKMQRCKHIKF